LALVVGTNVALATVRICEAFTVTAGDCVRFGDKTGLTFADRVSSLVCTEGIRTTRGGVTRIWSDNTSLTLTDISLVTVWVSYTFRSTTCDGIRFRYKSRFTSTDRISIEVYCTDSPWATG